MSHYEQSLDTILTDLIVDKIAYVLEYKDGDWHYSGGDIKLKINEHLLNGWFSLNANKIEVISLRRDVTTYVYFVLKDFLKTSIEEVIGYFEEHDWEDARDQLSQFVKN